MKKILTKKLESLQKAVFHYSAYAISVYSAAETIAAINTPNTREVVTGALLCILAAALPQSAVTVKLRSTKPSPPCCCSSC